MVAGRGLVVGFGGVVVDHIPNPMGSCFKDISLGFMVEAGGNDRGGQSLLNFSFGLKEKEDCGWNEWRLELDVSKDDIVKEGPLWISHDCAWLESMMRDQGQLLVVNSRLTIRIVVSVEWFCEED